jgi:hypothetical protein
MKYIELICFIDYSRYKKKDSAERNAGISQPNPLTITLHRRERNYETCAFQFAFSFKPGRLYLQLNIEKSGFVLNNFFLEDECKKRIRSFLYFSCNGIFFLLPASAATAADAGFFVLAIKIISCLQPSTLQVHRRLLW